ncbi:tetratricopeptide repeat protein 5 [Pelomyxa schiedti]|nr:tetratricopeptide repeat protein 5 [Pelomyxa schiedti]
MAAVSVRADGDPNNATEEIMGAMQSHLDAVESWRDYKWGQDTPIMSGVLLSILNSQTPSSTSASDWACSAGCGLERGQYIKVLITKIIEIMHKFPQPELEDIATRARLSYLEGRTLNLEEEYNPAAETLLSKAVKLDPKNASAWVALGECFAKKGDPSTAHHCFSSALALNGDNVQALLCLSIVLRVLPTNNEEEKIANFSQSLVLAKKAVSLNMNEPLGWYLLGNAYLTNVFINAIQHRELDNAQKAYKKALSLGLSSPDLCHNWALIQQYQGDYESAAQQYLRARTLEPSWNMSSLAQMEDKLLRIRTKLSEIGVRNNISSVLQAFISASGGRGNGVSLHSLTEGCNDGVCLVVCILSIVSEQTDSPVTVTAADSLGNTAVVLLHHIAFTAVTDFTILTVTSPEVRRVSYTHLKEGPLQFPCISTDFRNILINGQAPAKSQIAQTLATTTSPSTAATQTPDTPEQAPTQANPSTPLQQPTTPTQTNKRTKGRATNKKKKR